jgi:hypothetical protein
MEVTASSKSHSCSDMTLLLCLLQAKRTYEGYLKQQVDCVIDGGQNKELERLKSFYLQPQIGKLEDAKQKIEELIQNFEAEKQKISEKSVIKNKNKPMLLLWVTAAIFGSAYTMCMLHLKCNNF